jgi:tetratricopeptide (TPR) repeat protein
MHAKTIQHSAGVPVFADMTKGAGSLFASSAGQRQLLIYLLISVGTIVVLAHLPALSARAEFHDDAMYVSENPLVQNPSWRSAGRFFCEVWAPSTVRGYYQPLTMVSLMLDRFLAGPHESLMAYHRTSLFLHAANTVLIAVFLYMLFGRPIIAAGVSLLFGLHPVTVESVCWVAERKTVLATFFALGSLLEYIRYTRDQRRRYYVGCMLAYILALLSKPIVVPLPAMMLLMDHWPLGRLHRKSVTEKIPLFAIGVVFAAITYVSQGRAASIYLPGDYSPWRVPLILCHNIVFYLHKLLWPVNLSAHYAYTTHQAMVVGVVGTCLLAALLVILRRRTRALLTGLLAFFVMILPAMGIISVTSTMAANRYTYLPSVGLLMVIAALLVQLASQGPKAGHRVRQAVAVVFLLAVVAVETIPLRRYLAQWSNTVTLCQYLLTITPRSATLHADLGAALAAAGMSDDAAEHYRHAIAIQPNEARLHFNLATGLGESDESAKEAIKHYRRALEVDPSYIRAHMNLGSMFLGKNRLNEAIDAFEQTIRINPEYAPGYYNLGKAMMIAGYPTEGLEHLREAMRLSPGSLRVLKDLAWFLATHPNEAIRDPNEAVKIAELADTMTQGRDVKVVDTLAAAYACDEQYERAVETAHKALATAKRLRNYDLAADVEERLRLYDMGVPYWEAPRAQLDRMITRNKDREQQAPETSQASGLRAQD